MPDNNSSNSESSARTIGKVMKAVFSPLRWIIVVVVIVILTIVLVAAAIKVVLRLNAVDNSNDSTSSNYREYGPVAYTESMDLSDIENGNISFGMSVQDMWDNDSRYSEYLNSVDELEYLLWAQLVTQYPYKSGVSDDEFNGTVHFTRFISDNEQDMEWVSDSTLSNYVEKYNNGDSSVLNEALTSFSLNSDMTIKIAYLTEEKKTVVTDDEVAKNDALEKIEGSVATENGDGTYTVTYSSSTLSTTNISYVSYVQKYVLPFNLLWSIVVMGHSDMQQAIQLATSIADMAYDGEISLVIDDNNVYTESVDYYTYTLTEHYDGTMTATITETKTTTETQTTQDDDGNETTTVTGRDVDERTEDYTTTVDDYQVERKDYYAEYTEIHNTNSPSLKVKYIESWCAIFDNDATYTNEESSNASNPIEQDLEDTELIDVTTFSYDEATSISEVLERMRDNDGNKSELEEWNEDIVSIYNSNMEPDARSSSYDEDTGTTTTTTIDFTYALTYTGEIEETENYMNIHEESTTTTRTSGYRNGTVTSPVFNDEIVEKFNDPSVSSVRGTIVDTDDDGWFIPALEVNDDTANLVDLIKYIFNKADDEDVSDTDFASLWSSIYGNSSFDSVSTTSLMDFINDYINAWEGSTTLSEDGTKYKVEDDGSGNLAVGHGVDIEQSGYKQTFIDAGYSVSEGSWIDVDFVTEIEKEIRQEGYDAVVLETSGLNLTDYQIAALVSRYYNCGPGGWKTLRNGKTIVQAYNAYWSDEKTEEYYGQTSSTSIYAEEFYTQYMCEPTIANGEYNPGLENRRKSEWLLFTTGYADRIDTQYSETGDIVDNAIRIHEYIRENEYAYSCTHNVSAGYTNICDCDKTSHFGKALNASTLQEWYEMRCIDCSAFVSWVLYESGIDIGRQSSSFFYNGGYTAYTQYNWQKITDWNDLQAGDILVKSGHVGIYIGDGYTVEAGSTKSINREKSYGSITAVQNAYEFAVRVTK